MVQDTKNKVYTRPHTSIIKNSLKFLSWNIQASSSIEGNKFEIDGFINKIKGHDFICLQEIRKDVNLPGYKSFNNLRKDNSSGGVGILVKNELLSGVKVILNEEGSDFQICKLDRLFFKLTTDIYLINVYAKPYNSSSSNENSSGREIIKKVEDIINDLKKNGEIILCGDFNSRIGNHTGMLELDSNKFLPMPEDYTSDNYKTRSSQDTLVNPNGNHFLKLIMHNQLIILNGRTLGDFNGNFTSIQRQGCSVVDYIAVSKQYQTKVNYFKVQEFTEYSDHKPLILEIQCQQLDVKKIEPLESKYQPAPSRFIINNENKESFVELQKSTVSKQILTELNESYDTIQKQDGNISSDSVKNLNTKFVEHLQGIASNSFKKTKTKTNKKHKNNPWFNWQARIAKRELKKATKETSQFPDNEFIRHNFYRVKNSYKRLLSNSKN